MSKRVRRESSQRTWIVLGAIAAVIVAAIVIAVASGGGDDTPKSAAHETGAVEVDGAALPSFRSGADPAVGKPIPTLTGISFDGSPVTIAPNGKPQAIVFLSHSCPHCQAEVPRIVALERAGRLAGVDVTAVTTNTSPELPNYPPSAWLRREHWLFPTMVDSKQFTAADAYGLPAFPYFVFVDAQGKVAGRTTGEIPSDGLAAIFKALAAGQPLTTASNGQSTPAN